MSKEAMKLALEALESLKVTVSSRTEANVIDGVDLFPKQMAALQKALANEALGKMAENARELELDYELQDKDPDLIEQPAQQEPVAWICEGSSSDEKHAIDYWPGDVDDLPIGTQLYASPPAQRKPLTDEQICDLWSWSMTAEAERTANTQQHAFARAIEAAHGIGEKK